MKRIVDVAPYVQTKDRVETVRTTRKGEKVNQRVSQKLEEGNEEERSKMEEIETQSRGLFIALRRQPSFL